MENIINNPFYIKNYIPIISFVIGTLLLISLAITKVDTIFYIGLLYVFIAICINIIYSIYLLFMAYNKKINSEETLSRLGIAFLNIPITILYIYIVFNVVL